MKPGVTRTPLRIASVNETWLKAQPAGTGVPQVGDIVVAINARPASEWLHENEIFCRLPLIAQCPIAFHRNLARGLLFGHPDTSLNLELSRNGELVRTTVTEIAPVQPSTTASQSSVPQASSLQIDHPLLRLVGRIRMRSTGD